MTAREFLNLYRKADRIARRYRGEYERQIIMIDAVRSVSDNDGMPHGNGVSKPVETRAIELADAAEKYIEAEMEAIRIRQKVFDVVMQIRDDAVREVMCERYIELKPWHEVADVLHYSERQCHRYHRAGLDAVEDVIACQY